MLERFSRFFFQKRRPETDRAAAERELRSRYAPLRGLDPDRLVRAIEDFRAGYLGPLARIVEELETRDDTMCACSTKMRAAAARCPHQVLIREGVGPDDRERAEAHRRALERLWANVRATDALSRNARGGIRLLLKQMMSARSQGYAAHELVWRPRPDGSMDLTLVHVPLQFFEARTGALRYLRDPNGYEGEEMAEGEWMVTAGEGAGIAAAIAATFKRLSLQDWLLFSERCGQPGLHAATDAKQGSEQWNNLVAAVANFGREWGIVTDMATKVDTVSLANGGTPPYPALVERMDRAIAVLYRGSDLSTLSAGDGSVGASQQGEEADILEQDACEMLSETLQEQVERPFIRYVFGDDEPLAYIQVSPVARPDLDMEMKIDQHLVSLGVPLSRKEALERYQRSLASKDDPEDAPLKQETPPAGAQGGGFGYPNEDPAAAMPLQRPIPALQRGVRPSEGENARPEPAPALKRVLAAFRSDLGPAAEELAKVLALPEGEMRAVCKDLAGRLPDLLPADPAMAAVLAEELAGAFAEAVGETGEHGKDGEGLANETDAQGHEHAPAGSSDGGRFVSKDGGSSAAAAPSDAKKDEDGHTPEERKRIEEYQNAADPKAAEYYRVAQTLQGEDLKKAQPFVFAESCPQRMADEIKNQTGIDATGFPVKVDVGHARHTEIRHGEHGSADHSMDPESFARTSYVLEHFETCAPAMKNGKPYLNDNYRTADNKPSPQLQFRMRIDGEAVVQEAVQDAKNKVVWIVSSFRDQSPAEKEAKAARRAFFREWGKKKASQGKS